MIKYFLTIMFLAKLCYANQGGVMDAMEISAAGMKVQTKRLSVIAQNIANAESIALSPNEQTYRRQVISIGLSTRNSQGVEVPMIRKIDTDKSPLKVRFDPTHPAANSQGYILVPNVDKTIEIMDAREAERSYEANLNMMKISKNIATQTLEALR